MGVHQACQVRVPVGEEREREGKRDGGTPGMPGESYRRRLRSFLLSLWDVFRLFCRQPEIHLPRFPFPSCVA